MPPEWAIPSLRKPAVQTQDQALTTQCKITNQVVGHLGKKSIDSAKSLRRLYFYEFTG